MSNMDDIFNLNNAEKQRDQTLIPAGVYRLRAKVRPGNAGPGGVLRLAKNGRTLMLELELKVIGRGGYPLRARRRSDIGFGPLRPIGRLRFAWKTNLFLQEAARRSQNFDVS